MVVSGYYQIHVKIKDWWGWKDIGSVCHVCKIVSIDNEYGVMTRK